MPRIRTIKPEFFRSPSTAKASPWARLLFIAMWCWADDHGRAEWTPRELLGFAFPHDTEAPCNDAEFPRLCAEVADTFAVEFYRVGERQFYAIPTWDRHQKNERRAASRVPAPGSDETEPDKAIYDLCGSSVQMRGNAVQLRGRSVPGTGEQGNRGTGEQGSSSSAIASDRDDAKKPGPDDNPRPEVVALCEHLATRVRSNGHDATVGKLWHRACRLLLDRDGRTADQVRDAIDWATSDPFWATNIRSMQTLREKYSTLQAQARRNRSKSTTPGGINWDEAYAEAAELDSRTERRLLA